jgi:hypothetical protein
MKATGWAFAAIGVAVVAVAAQKAKKRVRKAAKVYIEEVSAGARPIQAVGTATAAFIGFAE